MNSLMMYGLQTNTLWSQFLSQGVIGLLSGNAKAYPFSAISQETVIDGRFTGEEVVITFDSASESGEAFVWWLKGRVLSFEPAAGWAGVAFMWDRETRSLWQVLIG